MSGEPFPRVARGASAVVIALGASVLFAWWARDIAPLKSVFAGFVTMKANTAAAFVIAGFSIGLQVEPEAPKWKKYVARGCATVVAAVGALTVFEYLSGVDAGIDQLLATAPGSDAGAPHPGRTVTPSSGWMIPSRGWPSFGSALPPSGT